MPIAKSAERRKYVQFAVNCLHRMTEPTSEAARDRDHEMAVEWIRRADAIPRPLKR
jgi:hypothetical protein